MQINDLFESETRRPWVFYHGTNSPSFDQFNPADAAKGEQYWNPLGKGMYVTNNPRFASGFGKHVHKVVIPSGASYRRINLQTWQRSTGIGLVMRALRRAFKKVGDNIDHWTRGRPIASISDIKKMPRQQVIAYLIDIYKGASDEATVREKAALHSDDQLRQFLRNRWSSSYGGVPRTRDSERAKAVENFRLESWRSLERTDPYTGLYESHAVAAMYLPRNIADAYADELPEESTRWFGKWDFVVFTETNDPMMFTDKETTWEVVIYNPAYQKTIPMDDRR